MAKDSATRETACLADAALQVLAAMMIVLTGAMVIVWMWRTIRNLDVFPGQQDELGAGWAVAGWVVPVVNHVLPCRVMSQMAREELDTGRSRLLVNLWWSGWVVQLAIGALAFLGAAGNEPKPVQAVASSAAGATKMHVAYFTSRSFSGYASAIAVAGVCLAVLIVAVSRSQADRITSRKARLAQLTRTTDAASP